jgi:hypothetical protein
MGRREASRDELALSQAIMSRLEAIADWLSLAPGPPEPPRDRRSATLGPVTGAIADTVIVFVWLIPGSRF